VQPVLRLAFPGHDSAGAIQQERKDWNRGEPGAESAAVISYAHAEAILAARAGNGEGMIRVPSPDLMAFGARF
jgi:hypothetical protein